jgi:hypothetical protein
MSAEVVFAGVIDRRVFDAEGEQGASGIYTLGVPGRALPFVVFRAYKAPNGLVTEEVRLIAPSGKLAYRWGPAARRMRGSMDLTVESDLVEEAHVEEAGAHIASFILDDVIVGEIEVPVLVQEVPAKLPKDVEDGFRRSDVIWIEAERDGRPSSAPVWFAYKQGKLYVLSQREPGPEEQTVPGIPGAEEVEIVTRRKGRDTSLHRFPASVRILEGPEWEEAAKALADRRRSRVGPPADSIARWRDTCSIAELTPLLPA